MIDVIFGAAPLIWCSRNSLQSNAKLIVGLSVAIVVFNIVRLTFSDYLVSSGVNWSIGHNAVSGVSYFLIWLAIREIRDRQDYQMADAIDALVG